MNVQFLVEARDFLLLQDIQIACGAHPTTYLMDGKQSFSGVKAARALSWPLTSIKSQV